MGLTAQPGTVQGERSAGGRRRSGGPQNHRMVGVGRDLCGHLVQPPAEAGSSRAGCTETTAPRSSPTLPVESAGTWQQRAGAADPAAGSANPGWALFSLLYSHPISDWCFLPELKLEGLAVTARVRVVPPRWEGKASGKATVRR